MDQVLKQKMVTDKPNQQRKDLISSYIKFIYYQLNFRDRKTEVPFPLK